MSLPSGEMAGETFEAASEVIRRMRVRLHGGFGWSRAPQHEPERQNDRGTADRDGPVPPQPTLRRRGAGGRQPRELTGLQVLLQVVEDDADVRHALPAPLGQLLEAATHHAIELSRQVRQPAREVVGLAAQNRRQRRHRRIAGERAACR